MSSSQWCHFHMVWCLIHVPHVCVFLVIGFYNNPEGKKEVPVNLSSLNMTVLSVLSFSKEILTVLLFFSNFILSIDSETLFSYHSFHCPSTAFYLLLLLLSVIILSFVIYEYFSHFIVTYQCQIFICSKKLVVVVW